MLLVTMGLMFTLNWSQTANSGWKSGYHFCCRMLMWIKWRGELDCQSFLNKPADSSVVDPCPGIQDAEIIPWIPGPGGKKTLDRDAMQHDPEKNVILVLLNGDHVLISIHGKAAPACHYQPCNFQDLLFIWGLFSSFLKCTLCTQTQIN